MAAALRTLLLIFLALPVVAQNLNDDVEKAVRDVLAKTGAPSASIALVKDGKLAHARAYGAAQLEPRVNATPEMRYGIGSISKQFTAAAILLLAEEGKLSLDDRVVRWLPELTRAKDVTIRNLLSMTSGYQDFWPQDYVMSMMLEPVAPQQIFDRWARIPLDFEPGTKYQYSNTNYVIAGVIAERVSGMPLFEFLQKRIFTPLGMTSVVDIDAAPLGSGDPTRYRRFGLGPLRVAPKEGRGWLFAMGGLAMTASDLAKWDASVIERNLLKAESYRELEREMLLASGVGARYGLGVSLSVVDGRRVVAHGGEVSGFTARNAIYPDDRAAVVVLTNLDATNASEQIASRLATLLFAKTDSATEPALALAKKIFAGLQTGTIDRSLFTSNANHYFSEQALKDFASSLGPLGTPEEFRQTGQGLRGGMTLRRYSVKFPRESLRITTFWMPDGKLEQFMVAAE